VTTYNRPLFETLKARIEADLAKMPAVLREPLSASWARVCHGQHGHLEWLDRQCSPLTCDLERLYDWAAVYFVARLMATASIGNVIATGNVGAMVLADTLLRGDNGLDYVVTSAVTLVAGNNNVPVRCTTAGLNTNLIAGQTLTLVDPIAGVDNSLTVAAGGITGGADDELVDDWRVRVADEWMVVVSRGARSGKPDDYRAWAKNAHPSVTTALVQTHTLGFGTVIVRPICNTLDNRLPTQAVIDAVIAKLTEFAPATADWFVTAPLVRNVVASIDLDAAVDTIENRTAITAAISASVLAEVSETSVLSMAELDAAIATVTTQYIRLAPLAEISVLAGEVLVLDEVTYS
jgi:uncharacterized phage protein gp47/JayE